MGYSKTFLPTLRVVITKASKYGEKWQPQIESHLGTAPKIECFRSLLATLSACIPILFGS